MLASRSLIDHLPNDAQVLEESRLLKRFVKFFCQPEGTLALPQYRDGQIELQEGMLLQR